MDDRRDEKVMYKFISRNEIEELEEHLQQTGHKFEITEVFDRSGYSPLHFAAFKNMEEICKLLCNYVLTRQPAVETPRAPGDQQAPLTQ